MSDDLQEIHEEALREFDRIQTAVYDERMQCLEDRRFLTISGAQWEGALGEQFANRPRFEVNKLKLAVRRIIGEYRQNRVTVDFVTCDGEEDTIADACDGLYRADEQKSYAIEAYDNAYQEAISGGMGAWRLRAEYEGEDEEDEDRKQRVCIEPLFDVDSTVFFGLEAKRQDKSDAKRCYVLTSMTPQAYEEEYDEDVSTWSKDIQQTQFDWCTPNIVYVAEYYRVEKVTETIFIWRGLAPAGVEAEEKELTEDEMGDDEYVAELQALGFREARRKKKTCKRVHKYILSGSRVLKDCGIIAGKMIPIIPVYGEREVIDGIERCSGLVRVAKDAQRISNVFLSWLADIASRFDISKPILAPEQIQGFEQLWADDNISRNPYLLANPIRDAQGGVVAMGPQAYTKPPEIPAAIAGMLQMVEMSLQELIGRPDANDKIQPHISGVAAEIITQIADAKTSVYMSNFARSMQRSGEVWLSMMRDIAVEENRKMKTLDETGAASTIKLNVPELDKKTGKLELANDMGKVALDVYAASGPSSTSKRAAAAKSFANLASMSTDPSIKSALEALAVQNMEGEGLADVRQWLRKRMVRQGVIQPTDEEIKTMQQEDANAKPDAQTQYLQAAAQNEQAKAVKAQSDMILSAAKAEETRAATAEILSKMDISAQKHLMEVLQQLQQGGIKQPTQPQTTGRSSGEDTEVFNG